MRIFLLLVLTGFLFSGCGAIVSALYTHASHERQNYRQKIYNYEEGKRITMEVSKYRKSKLVETKIFYERWPNGELKLISKKGFYLVKDGVSYTARGIPVPDGIIVEYFDSNYVHKANVYKDGVLVPYTLGYYDGYSSIQYLREKPGVYTWKGGVEYFERELTPTEWGNHPNRPSAIPARESDTINGNNLISE